METIRKIKLAHGRDEKSIGQIARDFNLSRNTVRKVLRSDATKFEYHRTVQPMPKMEGFTDWVVEQLEHDAKQPKKYRRTAKVLFEQLQGQGYEGGYDAVRRFIRRWREEAGLKAPDAYVPLEFAPGKAYQFDWSHEDVEIAGKPMRVKVAHMRLCASRAVYVRAYPRESQEMLFDAHARGFAFFGGVPGRGIYDNMKTAVTSVFTGKERVFNRRFLIMTDHYMVEPTACSPAAGWEKGQVEHQVQTIRGRFFQPRLRFASIEELNGWLEAECLRWAATHAHPEQKELTVAEALDLERSALQPMLAPFDGFHETAHAVTGTCLISFDRNRYSVMAKAARRAVQVRAYADRIVVRLGDEVIAEHARHFGRDRTIYDPWHYLPVLANKPGALRNGAPFQGWDLPPALTRLRRKLGGGDEADRRFVRVLAAVMTDGLEAVEAAIREALDNGAVSDEVILNILARYRDPPSERTLDVVVDLKLSHPPIADCARYDTVRGFDAAA